MKSSWHGSKSTTSRKNPKSPVRETPGSSVRPGWRWPGPSGRGRNAGRRLRGRGGLRGAVGFSVPRGGCRGWWWRTGRPARRRGKLVERVGDGAGDAAGALLAGEVGLVDQGAERVGDLGRPRCVGVDLGGAVEVSEQMRAAQLVDQGAQFGGIVVLVPVVDDHRIGEVLDHGGLEGVQ